MKKKVVFTAVSVVISFFLGWEGSMKFYNVDNLFEVHQSLRSYSRETDEALDYSLKALNYADSLIYVNDLYDTDGSDLMQDYLDSKNTLDTYLDSIHFGEE